MVNWATDGQQLISLSVLTIQVSLDQLINFSVFPFPYTRLFSRLNELIFIKYVEHCLAQSKGHRSICSSLTKYVKLWLNFHKIPNVAPYTVGSLDVTGLLLLLLLFF